MVLSSNGKSRLVNSFTSDPNLVSLDPEYHKGWFVRQSVWGKVLYYRASEAELNHILQQLLAYFYATAEDEAQYLHERERILYVVWLWLKPRLEHNKGLVKFMREYGVYSRYFVPLLMYVPGALALCPAHGECLDIFGRPQRIPKADKLYQFSRKDEMYAFARLRAEDAKPELEKAKRALILGAGTLQEVRQLQRFTAELLRPTDAEPWLVAYDSDTKLIDYFAVALDEPLERYGVDYRYTDFREAFANPDNYEAFDLVEFLGVASYYDDQLEWLLANARKMLSCRGVIKFDLQILDGGPKWKKRFWQNTLVFDKVIMRWESDMKPRKSVFDAIQRVEAVCARVGLEVNYYKYDSKNTIGIIFQCSRA